MPDLKPMLYTCPPWFGGTIHVRLDNRYIREMFQSVQEFAEAQAEAMNCHVFEMKVGDGWATIEMRPKEFQP